MPPGIYPRPSIADRLWAKIDKQGPAACWLWLGAKNPTGYGHLGLHGKTLYAHRVAYELLVGPIPPGLDLDHLCRNRGCCNPAHLEPVDRKTNLNRGEHGNAKKTHCKRGHEFTPDNTQIRKNGSRLCLACEQLRQSRRRRHAA